jgi:transglutaminase-like putative cysteine protease
VQQAVRYIVRLEARRADAGGDPRLKACGSCRDSAWLLVQILRHLGLAARFVSGYLIQLAPDVKPIDGPAGPTADFTDLHAWAEVFLPGAGWVGLDATSGLLAGEGHIPLAAPPSRRAPRRSPAGPTSAKSRSDFEMRVTRVHEDPRVTKPYTDAQWTRIEALGDAVQTVLDEATCG